MSSINKTNVPDSSYLPTDLSIDSTDDPEAAELQRQQREDTELRALQQTNDVPADAFSTGPTHADKAQQFAQGKGGTQHMHDAGHKTHGHHGHHHAKGPDDGATAATNATTPTDDVELNQMAADLRHQMRSGGRI